MTSVSKKIVYELDGREFISLSVVIFLFDSTSFFFARLNIGLKVFLRAHIG